MALILSVLLAMFYLALNLSLLHPYFTTSAHRILAEMEKNNATVLPVILAQDIIVHGDFNSDEKYVIFGSTLLSDVGHEYKYAFPLPLTALAWNRVGYRSIVVLVGTQDLWMTKPAGKLIYDKLQAQKAVVVFLDASDDSQTMISQVARIFIPAILGRTTNISREAYVITSDADLWPMQSELYELPTCRDILSVNSNCCRGFKHGGKKYKMLPMANIGMKVSSWETLIATGKFNHETPMHSNGMIEYLHVEFGTVANTKVNRGMNAGWFLDQRLITVLVKSSSKHVNLSVAYRPRNTARDRMDRIRWAPKRVRGKNDAHIPHEIYQTQVWNKVIPLIKYLHSDKEQWCIEYFNQFNRLI